MLPLVLRAVLRLPGLIVMQLLTLANLGRGLEISSVLCKALRLKALWLLLALRLLLNVNDRLSDRVVHAIRGLRYLAVRVMNIYSPPSLMYGRESLIGRQCSPGTARGC